MSKSDIELLFGLKGGGSPSGASGQNIQNQLNNIINNINKNPLEVDIAPSKGSVKNFQKELSNLTLFAQSEARKIQSAYQSAINSVKLPDPASKDTGDGSKGKSKSSTIEKDTTAYYKAVTKLQKLQTTVRENLRQWSQAGNGVSSAEYKNLQQQEKRLTALGKALDTGRLKADQFEKTYSKVTSSVATSADKIHFNEENTRALEVLKEGVKGYDQALISVNNKIVQVRQSLESWSGASTGKSASDYMNLEGQLVSLESLRKKLIEGKITSEEFANSFSVIKREISSSSEAIKRVDEAFKAGSESKEYYKQLDKVNDLLVRIKKNLADWSSSSTGRTSDSYKGLQETAKVLEDIRDELLSTGKTIDDFDGRFDQASSSAKQLATNIKLAGENVKSVKNNISNFLDKIGMTVTVADVFRKALEIGKEMVDVVTDVDTAMTELKKVTDEADATYVRFLDNAKTRAHALGATLADTVSATADFARLGNNIVDASSLADAAIVYKNVGDGIEDITTASESIISTMQAFGIEAKDAMSIVDSFNNVGNNFAISSKGIGDALLNSAASLHAAGNDIHESIALIAAANTTIQDPGKVGTALKTMSMYLRAAKTEAEEAGLSTENMASSVSELRGELLALTGGKVDIMSDVDAGKYKGTVETLRDLSAVWDDLSDTSKTNITELIGGGVRNANIISSLMQNFDIVEKALEKSKDSVGSAIAENEKYIDSIAGKFAQLQSSFETFSTAVLNSELVKVFVGAADAALRLLTVISDVAFDNFFTTLSTLALGGGAFALFKDLD